MFFAGVVKSAFHLSRRTFKAFFDENSKTDMFELKKFSVLLQTFFTTPNKFNILAIKDF